MGIISVSALETIKLAKINRLEYRKTAAIFGTEKGIPIYSYLGRSYNGLLKLKFRPISQRANVLVLPQENSCNLIWQSTFYFQLRKASSTKLVRVHAGRSQST